MRVTMCAAVLAAGVIGISGAQAQQRPPASKELTALVETERAFAERARATNWRDAFLEYFVDGMKGFEGEDVKARLKSRPAPPKELEFWWEPRYGDIAASGDLGWLTGPVRTRLPQANSGKPDFSNYASVWRRQPDGRYKVIEDVGISTPEMPVFLPGFTRAPAATRYTGSERGDAARGGLADADRRLTAALQRSQAEAYGAASAPYARLHRQRTMPIVGREPILAWSKTQTAWTAGESRFADVADSGDLGYTKGSYEQPAGPDAKGTQAESGYYLRVWSRDAQGAWWVVLDVTQPKRPQ